MGAWTFDKKIAAGFAVCFLLLVGVGGVAYRAITMQDEASAWVAHTHQVLERLAEVEGLLVSAESAQRGYVLTGDEAYLAPFTSAPAAFATRMRELRALVVDSPAQGKKLDQLETTAAERLDRMRRTVEARKAQGLDEAVRLVYTGAGKQIMDNLHTVLSDLDEEERRLLEVRVAEVAATARTARWTIIAGTLLALLVVIIAAWIITRSLTTSVGSAVQHMLSSAAELQSAANQQASGMRESSTAMSEISTTMSELLATSRQIADSSRRVSLVAGETSAAARAVDHVVQRTQDSMGGIRRQTEVIVSHMLDLGKKSQQIGGILELINELAEQTNILSINASIEAAGAGDAGRRFGVVADEIRKLADRVGGSTKEIRSLIDEIRAAVNSTVMATEGGTKAVEAGVRQFGEVTVSLQQIAGLVATTTDAAKEIELSTKQQSTAVEQVNIAVANVAKATRETEVSSGQTLETATQLTGLSRDLNRTIRATNGA